MAFKQKAFILLYDECLSRDKYCESQNFHVSRLYKFLSSFSKKEPYLLTYFEIGDFLHCERIVHEIPKQDKVRITNNFDIYTPLYYSTHVHDIYFIENKFFKFETNHILESIIGTSYNKIDEFPQKKEVAVLKNQYDYVQDFNLSYYNKYIKANIFNEFKEKKNE